MLEKVVKAFLSAHLDHQRPILLAYSGGTDSLVLLHVLLKLRKDLALKLALAHVDHGWRPESASEADAIVAMAAQHELPVHVIRLQPDAIRGNLEAICREKRLEFFSSLCLQYNYQAVLIAQHADDLAETVLKRVLEGTSLPYLSSMKEESTIYQTKIWRPLLTVPKTLITDYLAQHDLQPFYDPTNDDQRFLRAKLRHKIIPFLSTEFNKEVRPGLCKIGAEAAELRDYLDMQIAPLLAHTITGPLGSYLDVNPCLKRHKFEVKYLIQKFCEAYNFSLTRDSLIKIYELLGQSAGNKHITHGSRRLEIDRGKLLFYDYATIPLPTNPHSLVMGETVVFGPWEILALPDIETISIKNEGWKSLWQGELRTVIPKQQYLIQAPSPSLVYPGKNGTLSKWWGEHKVPAFLSMRIPVLTDGKNVQYEFLSGKNNPNNKPNSNDQKIRISVRRFNC